MSMKIVLARVDKRLLHATVTLNCDPFLNADYVAVVGSEYDNDPFNVSVMQLCLPKTMKVKILTEEGLLDFLNQNDTSRASTVLVIFKDLASVRESVKRGFYVEEIQMPYPTLSVAPKNLTDYFSKEELEDIDYIQEQNIRFYFQTTPFQAKDYGSFCK